MLPSDGDLADDRTVFRISDRLTGLAGYRITLKDGTEFNFSNVFGKMRKGITEALDQVTRSPTVF